MNISPLLAFTVYIDSGLKAPVRVSFLNILFIKRFAARIIFYCKIKKQKKLFDQMFIQGGYKLPEGAKF